LCAQPIEIKKLPDRHFWHRGHGKASWLVPAFYDASSGAPTIFLLKPDAQRYWTRTMALNDADQVCADLFNWSAASRVDQG
jgi:hypothetical protein